MSTYRNQYWLRIVSVQRSDDVIIESSPLTTDIIETLNILLNIEESQE